MQDESICSPRYSYVEYVIRHGVVARNAQLVEIGLIADLIACPNPRCKCGGFRIRKDRTGVQSERCQGFVTYPGNLAEFCNFRIRYRVRKF